jgi:hypothetical protein
VTPGVPLSEQAATSISGYLPRGDRRLRLRRVASVEHHDLTPRTLLDVDGITEVVIVSRPGVVPYLNAHPPRGHAPARPHNATTLPSPPI